ncbi:hypothetical protein NDI56_02540 [Haloarcula sp. S1CR25-12]|uniref:SCP domain-containing protein n=1 Tax=Haloarcula saliterrae TaxID=2950534 RepID=A0ABU2F7P6_9EURY|nr:CAP domain-containing protein [Haloarcula sp. S1CR25-12]MDS0258285.1 hypothetical protein [Haloarcula sp. S1CR25-12]
MVNKAFLSLAAVVLFAVFGTGIFVGMQVGGPDVSGPPAAETTEADEPAATATPVAPASTPTPTPASEQDSDPEPAGERESIPAREFNGANISSYIVQYVNDARADDGREELSTEGTTAGTVRRMAQRHADSMAEAGRVNHTIDGVTSADRYENNGLFQTCGVNVNGNYVVSPDNDDLEVVGGTVAGDTYTEDGTEQFNADDAAVARALVDGWLSTRGAQSKLLIPDAGRIGVGVTVNNRGVVYATVNLCS